MVGGSTIFGAALGLVFRRTTREFNDGAMSLAAGVMLAAAIIGLILPSLEYSGDFGFITASVGIFLGALCVNLMDRVILRLYPDEAEGVEESERARGVLLFVTAIAIHNLPEGIAAGVGFGTGDVGDGLFIAVAIAMQNIPEGMTVLIAMLGIGIKPLRAFFIAAMTGVVEIIGTYIGYLAVNISVAILPFILAFAGGNMLYVIADEMIPASHSKENHRPTYLMLVGFCFMLMLSAIL